MNADKEVYIGSVKTNIGHLEAAAGVAGLIKVLLMMKHDTIVPSLWYSKENENPLIMLSQHGFVVPTECKRWERSENKNRIASVNSFGFGGTNAHCIVEEYIPKGKHGHDTESYLPFIVTLSANSRDSLIANVRHMNDALKLQVYDISAVSYTSTCRRDHRSYRKAVFGKNQDDIITATGNFLRMTENISSPIDSKKVVFVFCGVGTVWKGMCSSLMKIKVFKEAVLDIDKHLKPLSGMLISSKLYGCDDVMTYPLVSHIAIFACQIGLAALWKSLGITPDVVIGQSVGEVAAAYVAGFLDLQTAVKIIFFRSKLLAAVKPGRMAVVRNVKVDVVKKYCDETGSLTVAVFNSSESCTVSGMAEDIKNLKDYLSKAEGISPEVIQLDVQCAYHSPYVEKAANELGKHLHNIQYRTSHTPMLSTVTGKLETNGLFGTSDYWEKNVKMPVLFSDAIKSLESKMIHNIFLELGPSPVLRAHIRNILEGSSNYTSIPSMHKKGEIKTFTEALCSLFELGLKPQWSTLFPHPSHVTEIPTYQFSKYRTLYQSPSAIIKTQGIKTTNAEHLYVKQTQQKDDGSHFKVEIGAETTHFVYEHIVTNLIILPGATYADVGFEIGINVLGLSKHKIALSLEFLRPVKVETGVKTILHISTVPQKEQLLFHAKHNNVTMCKGWVQPTTVKPLECQQRFDIECFKLSISKFGCKHMSEDEMYANLESMGFKYGPCFTLMKDCSTNGIESLTEIEVPDDIVSQYELTTLHPCVLDAMMQSTINTTTEEILHKIRDENLKFLPVSLGDLRMSGSLEKKMYIFTRRINTTVLDSVLQVHYNILLLSKNGIVLADLRNYTTYGRRNTSLAPCELNYCLTWQPLENKSMSKYQPTDILILTNKASEHIGQEFGEYENILICQNERNLSKEEFVANAFKQPVIHQEVPAVVLVIEKHDIDGDINASSARNIHECVKNNCMLLTALVRYMTNNNITAPLYVVTQNTQPTFSNTTATINLVGEELWGFTRSIHIEFIHGDITLIDLQPSLQETKNTLVSFIRDSCHKIKQTKPEIIIHNDTIYGAQFTKIPRKEIIPTLRAENKISTKDRSTHKVLADRSQGITTLILTQSEETGKNTRNNHIYIQIKNVCLHPLSIYPRTTSGICLDQDVWKENLADGHNLFGLEYTGYQIPDKSNMGTTCRKPEINITENGDHFNKWEILTIFPSEISTKMSVPKSCTVNLKDIPFYQPGLILTTVLIWNLSKHVPKHSSVLVYSSQALTKYLMEALLHRQRNAIIVNLSKYENNNESSIDVLITIERLDPSFPLLGRCKKIICLEGCVSEPVHLNASRSGEQTIANFSPIQLLDEKFVSKCLSKVVLWLQKHYKNPAESFFRDNECRLPLPCLEIMRDGKVVLPIRNSINNLFNKSDIYIVTGGLTGLGWEFVLLLAEMGAGVIGSISRQDRTEDKVEEIKDLEKTTGCKIIHVTGDVSDLKSISEAMKKIESYAKQGAVRGVFHGAGVLDGKLLMNLEESQLDSVLKPKVIGTMNLHIVTKKYDLDYFVVPSSINSLIGSPGQSSYGAANSFLDTFMEWRRRQWLAGQAINWGALGVGMASRPEFVENFTKRGFNLLSVLEIRSCLQDALMRNATSVIYTNIDWDICAKDYANAEQERARLQMSVLLEQTLSHNMVIDNGETEFMSFDVKALRNAGTERQLIAITQVIQMVSSKVIAGDISEISMTNTLAEMAFDSMSTVTFINIVHDITGYRIPPTFMLDTKNTLNGVVQLLLREIFDDKVDKHDPIELERNEENSLLKMQPTKYGTITPIEM